MEESNRQRALVTGASEGIGREFVIRLANQGYQVTAVARNEGRLRSLVEELPGEGHSYLAADLARHDGVEQVAIRLREIPQDLLINNAGFGLQSGFAEADMTTLQEMLQLNIDCVVHLSHAFLQNSKTGDALVNVSSLLSFMPTPYNGVYAATKAFVTSFSETLWYEQKDRGVYVMALCPGATHSRFAERAGFSVEDIPQFIMQNADQVVNAALDGLKSRSKPTVISGPVNKGFGLMSRLMSRRMVVSAMGKQM